MGNNEFWIIFNLNLLTGISLVIQQIIFFKLVIKETRSVILTDI
uniref:Uncharacterized protein n=1 Tax=Rhizophora mucronata TaxID=61149 RepID=A0A2P2PWH3_RHIMU